MLNNVHHEFRCEIYLVKDDGKLPTFRGIAMIIIMRIVFSFLHVNYACMSLKENLCPNIDNRGNVAKDRTVGLKRLQMFAVHMHVPGVCGYDYGYMDFLKLLT